MRVTVTVLKTHGSSSVAGKGSAFPLGIPSWASKCYMNKIKIMLARKKQEVTVGQVINKICNKPTSLSFSNEYTGAFGA